MSISKRNKILLFFAVIVILGAFFFFYRMYNHDVQALADFSGAYQNYDQAISGFSANKTAVSETQATSALADLNAKANFGLSSLIKNDSLIPAAAHEVADSAEQEFADLKTNNQYFVDVSLKRKTAYARFLELTK